MANFNEDGLKKKLDDLNMSQQSIQTLSLWLIHHKKHAHTVVNVWLRELVKASESRKLTFMYLANDVIQNSKKKGPEYSKEFGAKLSKVFEHLGSYRLDEKTLKGVNRLLTVWEERSVYSGDTIKELRKSLAVHLTTDLSHCIISLDLRANPYIIVNRRNSSKLKENHKPEKRELNNSYETITSKKSRRESLERTISEERSRRESESEVHISLSPTASPKDPPEPEQLIQALQDLENAATSDAAVREKIASLPVEVSDVNLLHKLQDTHAGKALHEEVECALALLESYNKRLAEEMEARKAVARMLHDYITHQKDLLAQAEEKLEEHRQKLHKVQKVRTELKAHLQNLPDISKLPSITGVFIV
ncbi:regulation of nuclear pre-mRNA domain-containing protein 1A isoform X2 [Oratosquilla oratoria]|uniref:regulation of nuclear pre-mRNA domain-containing protein 1A isoform X2 n=1 Tax=Oratosquilla oratoria TaxID=337810 RepID=UPI003F75F7E0